MRLAFAMRVKVPREMTDRLRRMPARLRTNIMRGGVRAIGSAIAREAKVLVAPIRTGALRRSIRVSVRANQRSGIVRGVVKAGGRNIRYANLIEYGVRPHEIRSRPGKRGLTIGRSVIVRVVQHPGVRPRRYMAGALDRVQPRAGRIFGSYVTGRIVRYWETGR